MTFKGSVVVKRTHLLNMISNMKTMFRKDMDDTSKWHIWGQQIGYERLLENDISDYNWDEFIKWMWGTSWTVGTKPYEMFEWLESSELLLKDEPKMVRSGGHAIYNGERIWVSNVGGKKDMALIVFNSDGDDPEAIRAEWVLQSSLGKAISNE